MPKSRSAFIEAFTSIAQVPQVAHFAWLDPEKIPPAQLLSQAENICRKWIHRRKYAPVSTVTDFTVHQAVTRILEFSLRVPYQDRLSPLRAAYDCIPFWSGRKKQARNMLRQAQAFAERCHTKRSRPRVTGLGR